MDKLMPYAMEIAEHFVEAHRALNHDALIDGVEPLLFAAYANHPRSSDVQREILRRFASSTADAIDRQKLARERIVPILERMLVAARTS